MSANQIKACRGINRVSQSTRVGNSKKKVKKKGSIGGKPSRRINIQLVLKNKYSLYAPTLLLYPYRKLNNALCSCVQQTMARVRSLESDAQ